MRKTTLTVMALLALCMPARSQNVIMTDRMSSGGFEPIPKELANDGVAYMAVYDFHDKRTQAELMVARSQSEVKASVKIDNSETASNYWQKSANGTDWEFDFSDNSDSGYEPTLLSFEYRDVDNSYYPTSKVMISQNLFNSDDKWEYIVADVDFLDTPDQGSESTQDDMTYRHITRIKVIKGFKIMNQDGTELAYCKMPDSEQHGQFTMELTGYYIAKIDGMLYMSTLELIGRKDDYRTEYHCGMYLINPKTSSIQAIGRVCTRMSVSSTDQTINVMVSDAKSGEKVSVTSMDGRLIGTAQASESLSFPRPDSGSGIYNITLQSPDGTQTLKVK